MRERKRKHDDAHYPMQGRGKRATPRKAVKPGDALAMGEVCRCDECPNVGVVNSGIVQADVTPKTLTGAILNGVNECLTTNAVRIACATQPHVRDFLAQKFGVAVLQSSDDLTRAALMVLFESITGEKLK